MERLNGGQDENLCRKCWLFDRMNYLLQ